MENRDKIAALLQAAHASVTAARALAPNRSNLSDELDATAETLDNLQSSVQCNEYDSSGMAI